MINNKSSLSPLMMPISRAMRPIAVWCPTLTDTHVHFPVEELRGDTHACTNTTT